MLIFIVFCDRHGHVYKLARAVAEGVQSVESASVKMFRTAELGICGSPHDKSDVQSNRPSDDIPVISASALVEADAIIFGTTSKSGMMAASMHNLLDQTHQLRLDGALTGKVGSVFASTTIHNSGAETTFMTFYATLLHLGMIVVGVPFTDDRLLAMTAFSGRNPYGALALVDPGGFGEPGEMEIAIAHFQGQYVAEVTRHLLLGKKSSTDKF
ncbi:MAG: NAD(P)H:quinone oxidoreductase [Deltaproteobacteria bacterium]|nr:NAD(P)H:quinone oxidoreductase [Deltaproteobacteria bacterium]